MLAPESDALELVVPALRIRRHFATEDVPFPLPVELSCQV
jgi:hypothetical protein